MRLHRQNKGTREIARLLGMGRNTERQYREALTQAGLIAGSPEQLPTLEDLKPAIASAHPAPFPTGSISSSMTPSCPIHETPIIPSLHFCALSWLHARLSAEPQKIM